MRNVLSGTVLMVGVVSVSLVLAQSTTTGPSVKPAAVAAKAGSPAPAPANSKTTKSAGAGKVNVSTANSASDVDSFWVERVDLDGDGDAEELKALETITPRVGFIRTPNSLGWDLRYAYDFPQPDGTRKIVIATDKPVSFGAGVSGAESLDYSFTLLEMRMGADNEGEGRMLARSAISTKDGKIQFENYGNEPIKMSEITEEANNK